MMLARLSAPRSLCPDLENWFQQDQSRISRFWREALIWFYYTFSFTLQFDKERLRQKIPYYSRRVGEALHFLEPSDCRCWAFIDGTFRRCCRPEFMYVHQCFRPPLFGLTYLAPLLIITGRRKYTMATMEGMDSSIRSLYLHVALLRM